MYRAVCRRSTAVDSCFAVPEFSGGPSHDAVHLSTATSVLLNFVLLPAKHSATSKASMAWTAGPIYPCNPATARSESTKLGVDPKGEKLVYTNGRAVIVSRPVPEQI